MCFIVTLALQNLSTKALQEVREWLGEDWANLEGDLQQLPTEDECHKRGKMIESATTDAPGFQGTVSHCQIFY